MNPSKRDVVFSLATGAALLVVLAVVVILFGQIALLGAPALSVGFLTEAPSSDLTGGGIFPALYGTALLTVLMTLAVVPVGVATAVYLVEYASPRSRLAALVRVAVVNLAGVPSIVFGLFGLGFFVLFVGGSIDSAFYDTDEPIWGQPSVLWASLTLAMLTLPVVIVTTEEAIRAVPRELREAAYGLGATRFQVLVRVIFPNARSGILTGVILAVSRGAGEVAPIMFTGVANFLPELPTDVRATFMHLGYHVYVLATQSPNVDRARETVFGTALVLLLLVFTLNALAIVIRSRSRRGLAR